MPPPKLLPNVDPNDIFLGKKTSRPFLVDNVFPWSQNIMKPYPQLNCNDKKPTFGCRLSYFHRVSKNALGILACRFRLFFGLSNLTSKVAVDAILAAVILQNLFRCKSCESCTFDFVD